MSEEEGIALAKSTFKQPGLLRGWHATYVRFGSNTVLHCYDTSVPRVALAENDISATRYQSPIARSCR